MAVSRKNKNKSMKKSAKKYKSVKRSSKNKSMSKRNHVMVGGIKNIFKWGKTKLSHMSEEDRESKARANENNRIAIERETERARIYNNRDYRYKFGTNYKFSEEHAANERNRIEYQKKQEEKQRKKMIKNEENSIIAKEKYEKAEAIKAKKEYEKFQSQLAENDKKQRQKNELEKQAKIKNAKKKQTLQNNNERWKNESEKRIALHKKEEAEYLEKIRLESTPEWIAEQQALKDARNADIERKQAEAISKQEELNKKKAIEYAKWVENAPIREAKKKKQDEEQKEFKKKQNEYFEKQAINERLREESTPLISSWKPNAKRYLGSGDNLYHR